ncbi:hypothetical protein KP509_19G028500 [Ceratopteris richardii]|uniref:eIF-4F 25 kDa subunit n=1 Tax=Ceratopteris richardii TaxID=49495 RepID=A0A8T2SMH4_CERRI|nr:hypothetical protein KP509_19G028500 [Ceratopteris richardii]
MAEVAVNSKPGDVFRDSGAAIMQEEVSQSADPPQKHPLEHAWTIWFDNTGKTKQTSWGSALRPVYTFSTVEDFWCLYNNVIQPSRLVQGTDFHCFKEGISPQWEDPKCAHGGKWTIAGSRGKSIDTYWLDTLLALIGEQFDEGDEICGVVVSIRPRQDKISLWTKTASNEAAQMSIGRQWKEFLEFTDSIGFIAHEDAKKSGGKSSTRYYA